MDSLATTGFMTTILMVLLLPADECPARICVMRRHSSAAYRRVLNRSIVSSVAWRKPERLRFLRRQSGRVGAPASMSASSTSRASFPLLFTTAFAAVGVVFASLAVVRHRQVLAVWEERQS